MDGFDGLAGRAADRHVSLSLGAKMKRFFKTLPDGLRNRIPVAVAIGVAMGIFAWDIFNSYLGFQRVFPSRGLFVIAVSLSSAGGYIWSHHKAAEKIEEGVKTNKTGPLIVGVGWAIAALVMATISFFGTFSNIVADSLDTGKEQKAIEARREAIQADVDRLTRIWTNMPVPSNTSHLQEDLDARMAEAEGWKMANLDVVRPNPTPDHYPGPGCIGDLQSRQRFLCNEAADLRGQLSDNAAAVAAKKAARADIETKAAELTTLPKPPATSTQWEAMQEMTSGKITDKQFQTWGLFLISVGLMFFGGAITHHILQGRKGT